MSKIISDIITDNTITIDVNQTIKDAAVLMKEYDIGFLPVMQDDILIGVVTDRDIVLKGYAKGLSKDTTVGEVMTEECIAVEKTASVDDVADVMAENKIRRVCVIDKDELVGICAIGDIAISNYTKRDAGQALTQISIPSKHSVLITNL